MMNDEQHKAIDKAVDHLREGFSQLDYEVNETDSPPTLDEYMVRRRDLILKAYQILNPMNEMLQVV